MEMIKLTIDGQEVSVSLGSTVLQAAKALGIHIPQLCFLDTINEIGACRICVVEVQGQGNLPASCVLPVSSGMVVKTHSPRVLKSRRKTLELLLSAHPADCLQCVRSQNCALQNLSYTLNAPKPQMLALERIPLDSQGAVQRDPNKCIICQKCVAVCSQVQSVNVLGGLNRGMETMVGPAFSQSLVGTQCTFCGQCIQACPVGAIYERNDTARVWDILQTAGYSVVQVAPAVRVSIGEEFGLEPGTDVTGRLVAGLRRLGFKKIFDTDFTADVTIMEEGHEFLDRFQKGDLPLITSCSPGWIRFVEELYPSLLHHVSSCKSPQQMFGALAKTYFAEKEGISPEEMKVVSIMPCTAKKFEADRMEMEASGFRDVDVVLTTRELAFLFRQAGIDLKTLEEEEFDHPMGASSGASVLFGQSGGVMAAALRTLTEVYPEILQVKEEGIFVGDTKVETLVVSSLAEARKVMDDIQSGTCTAHFIEVMACPGGCVAGGGQPISCDATVKDQKVKARKEALISKDKELPIRASYQNPAVKELYDSYLGKPLSERSHHLLHTSYGKDLE